MLLQAAIINSASESYARSTIFYTLGQMNKTPEDIYLDELTAFVALYLRDSGEALARFPQFGLEHGFLQAQKADLPSYQRYSRLPYSSKAYAYEVVMEVQQLLLSRQGLHIIVPPAAQLAL